MPPKRRGRGAGRAAGKAKKPKKAVSDSEVEASSSDDEKGFSKDKLLSVMRYDFDRLLTTDAFLHPDLVSKISPEDFNIDYYEKTGLETPLFFRCDPAKLGMKVPIADEFTVDNVLELVGGDRVIEVVEVSGQTSVKMNLKEFVDYYRTPKENRTTLYNVLSLEFTLDKMRDIVHGPSLVKEVDWVENCWPDALYQRYISFNKKGYQLYHTFPKVQNYCLMSVERCYTDFHIDFGGTSVWYHVLKGQKVFWMVEPTEANIRVYEEFVKNQEQTGFFGDVVDKCCRVVLNPGDTMIIPSGWIHAVYTPVDSLVFGGNFMHSLRASMQIRVFQSENRISVTKKFRFPYLDQLIFYVIAQVVEEVTGRKYARPLFIKNAKLDYVGKRWIGQNGHHKLITPENFQTDVGDERMWEDDGAGQEPGSKNVIAMHAENTLYDSENLKEDEDTKNFIEKEENRPTDMDIMKKGIFYHEQSGLYDLHTKSTGAHKNPIGEEPPLTISDEKLMHMSQRRLLEYEKLCEYMRKKRLVEVAEGITRPASLLLSFQALLERRRTLLEESGVEMESAPWAVKKKRTYKRSATHESLISPIKKTNHFLNKRLKQSKQNEKTEATDSDDHLEKSHEDVASPTESQPEVKTEEPEKGSKRVRKVDENDETDVMSDKNEEIGDAINENSEEIADVKDVKIETIADVKAEKSELDPLLKESIQKEEMKSADEDSTVDVVGEENKMDINAGEKSGTVSKEQLKKPRTRGERRSTKKSDHSVDHSKSFEEALMTNVKPRRKSDSKKDKPLFAGGIPLVPLLEDDPDVPNPYNYDPKAEIMKLGTGQLKSAYRKSKTNIELPREKKIYKLEHKMHEEEKGESSTTTSNPTVSSPSFSDPNRISFIPRLSETPEPAVGKRTEKESERTPEKRNVMENSSRTPTSVPSTSRHKVLASAEKPSHLSSRTENRAKEPRIPEPVKPQEVRPSDPRKPAETKQLIPAHLAITKLGEVVRQLEALNNEW